MFTEERQSAIEKCLRENGKVKVKELSAVSYTHLTLPTSDLVYI